MQQIIEVGLTYHLVSIKHLLPSGQTFDVSWAISSPYIHISRDLTSQRINRSFSASKLWAQSRCAKESCKMKILISKCCFEISYAVCPLLFTLCSLYKHELVAYKWHPLSFKQYQANGGVSFDLLFPEEIYYERRDVNNLVYHQTRWHVSRGWHKMRTSAIMVSVVAPARCTFRQMTTGRNACWIQFLVSKQFCLVGTQHLK